MAKPKLILKGKNISQYEGFVFKITGVRASYPHLDKPYAGDDGGEPKFSLTGLMDKKTHKEAFKILNKGIEDFIASHKTKIASDKRCLKDGDDTDKDENQGNWIVSARETKRPSVRDADGETIDKDDVAEAVYGGCYCDMMIKLWYQKNQYGKRINANLIAVKFNRDGEAFGEGRIDDEEMWDDDDDDTPSSRGKSKSQVDDEDDWDDEEL